MSTRHSLSSPEAQKADRQNSKFNTICNLCSVGCTIEIDQSSESELRIKSAKGLINSNSEYCAYPAKAFNDFSKHQRITTPLLKNGTGFIPVGWDEAFNILHNKIINGNSGEKAFFAGARLTNEEQFLIMKLCRAGAYTNEIGSFHYLGRGTGYTRLSRANIPFAELVEAKKVFIIGAEVFRDNPVAGHLIFENQEKYNIPVKLVTNTGNSELIDLAIDSLIIRSYFHFVRAINHYLVAHELEDTTYISNLVDNFDDYRKDLLSISFAELCSEAGITEETAASFAMEFRDEAHAVIVFSENELSGHSCGEIFNLGLLTGKHGRTGAGLMLLKENNNTHGLHDMGVMWNLGPGATPWDDPFQRSTVEFTWRSNTLPTERGYTLHKFRETGYESVFVFGEDPVGCAINPADVNEMLSKSGFLMVQDYFLTPTAKMADLVLPASFPYETGGTFTNSQRVIQKVNKRVSSPLEYDSWKQLEELLNRCGYDRYETIDDITFEIASLLPKFCTSSKLLFRINHEDNYNPLFRAGCDAFMHLAKQA